MAQFPSSVANDSNLYVAVNSLATTLVGALTSSGGNYSPTEIQVSDTTAWPTSGFITIDSEAISYTGISAGPARFTGISRGADGTIAAAHANGTAVKLNVIAAHHNVLKEEVKAIEQNLSDRIGLGSTQIKVQDGSAGTPSISFANDLNTGMYSSGADSIGLATNGVARLGIYSYIEAMTNGFLTPDGSVTVPSYSFTNDTNTGIYRAAADVIGVTCGGTKMMDIGSTGVAIKGTTTNDSASAGWVGEYIESVISTFTNYPTSTQYGDLTSISLTAGDWDVTALIEASENGATITGDFRVGISTTSGNSGTGLVTGSNHFNMIRANSTQDSPACIANYRVSLSTTTTVYLKYRAAYSSGTPQAVGRISARRVR
jgi:hypothetical protein